MQSVGCGVYINRSDPPSRLRSTPPRNLRVEGVGCGMQGIFVPLDTPEGATFKGPHSYLGIEPFTGFCPCAGLYLHIAAVTVQSHHPSVGGVRVRGVYVPLDIAGATLDTPARAMLDKPPAFGIGSPPPIFDIGSSPPTFVICNASWACAGPCLFASFPVSGGVH